MYKHDLRYLAFSLLLLSYSPSGRSNNFLFSAVFRLCQINAVRFCAFFPVFLLHLYFHICLRTIRKPAPAAARAPRIPNGMYHQRKPLPSFSFSCSGSLSVSFCTVSGSGFTIMDSGSAMTACPTVRVPRRYSSTAPVTSGPLFAFSKMQRLQI